VAPPPQDRGRQQQEEEDEDAGIQGCRQPPSEAIMKTLHLEVLSVSSGRASRRLPSKGLAWPPAKHAPRVGLLFLFF